MNHDLVYMIKLQANMFNGTHVLLDEIPNKFRELGTLTEPKYYYKFFRTTPPHV